MLQRELQIKQERVRREFESERDDELQRQQSNHDINIQNLRQITSMKLETA